MYKTAFYLLILLSSCQDQKKIDIKGIWTLRKKYNAINIEEIKFMDNNEVILHQGLFIKKGMYQLKNDTLKIKRDEDQFTFTSFIKKLTTDSLIIFDSLVFIKNHEILNDYDIEVFDFLNIPTNHLFSEINLRKEIFHPEYFNPIFLYHNQNKQLKLKLGEKESSFSDIARYFSINHSTPVPLLFVGKEIRVSELKKLYLYLFHSSTHFIYIVTKQKGIKDYYIFRDRFHLWDEEIESFNKVNNSLLPTQPRTNMFSKEDFLQMTKSEWIKINSIQDTFKFKTLNQEKKYLISIDANLKIKCYIQVIQNLLKQRQKNSFDFKISIYNQQQSTLKKILSK